MRYEIVSRIVIEQDTVFVTAAISDQRPLSFVRRQDETYTAIFRSRGIHGLLTAIGHRVYHGKCRLRGNSMITRAIRRGLHALTLEQFQAMEESDAVQWLAEQTQQVLQDWDHDPAADLQYESQPRPENPAVTVRLFGYVELENELGRFSEGGFEHPLSMDLIKYLLLHPRRGVELRELMDTVWPANKQGGQEESAAVLRLRRAREALRPLGLGGVYGLIRFRDGVYRLDPDYRLNRDVDEFDALLEQLQTCPVEEPEGLRLCVRALEVYRGPFLEHSRPAAWFSEERQRYEQAFLTLAYSALERLQRFDDDGALDLLCRRAAAVAPREEPLHRRILDELMARKAQPLLLRHIYQLSQSDAGWLEGEKE